MPALPLRMPLPPPRCFPVGPPSFGTTGCFVPRRGRSVTVLSWVAPEEQGQAWEGCSPRHLLPRDGGICPLQMDAAAADVAKRGAKRGQGQRSQLGSSGPAAQAATLSLHNLPAMPGGRIYLNISGSHLLMLIWKNNTCLKDCCEGNSSVIMDSSPSSLTFFLFR